MLKIVDGEEIEMTQEEIDEFNAGLSSSPVEEPFMSPPRIVAAVRAIEMADNEISGIGSLYNVAAALYLDVGQILIFFAQPVTGEVFISGTNGIAVSISEKEADYCILDIRNFSGEPTNPARLDVILSSM